MKSALNKPVAVLGTGTFGAVIASIIAQGNPVLIYSRTQKRVDSIKAAGQFKAVKVSPNMSFTVDIKQVADSCEIIFIMVPSVGFKDLLRRLAPFLKPYHIIIHGTKGLDINAPNADIQSLDILTRKQIRTMSQLIEEETVVNRIGCIGGPNISNEMALGLPAATVVASGFTLVQNEGKRLLNHDKFRVFLSDDLIGVELCGVLKNIIALAAGTIRGLNLGDNAFGLLISRGLVEMVYLGEACGGNLQAFIGLAGVGDMVTTSISEKSRNFQFGYRIAKGENRQQILASMDEPAEGVNTVLVMKKLSDGCNIRTPILDVIYKVLYEDLPAKEGVKHLMKIPQDVDIDFI